MILPRQVDSQGRPLLDVGMALSTASADTSDDKVSILICVYLSSGTTPKLNAATKVDSNISLSVCNAMSKMPVLPVLLFCLYHTPL